MGETGSLASAMRAEGPDGAQGTHPDSGYRPEYPEVVQAALGRFAQPVETFAEIKADRIARIARRHLGDPGSLSVVDVGCGIGLTDSFLGRHFGRVTGVDQSAEALEVARERNPAIEYLKIDNGELPVPVNSQDLAVAINVLHHVPVDGRHPLVAEMARVTRPGGLMVVLEHNPLNPFTRRVVRSCELDHGVSMLRKRAVERLLVEAGASIRDSAYVTFLPFGGPRLARVDLALGWLPLGAQHIVAASHPLDPLG